MKAKQLYTCISTFTPCSNTGSKTPILFVYQVTYTLFLLAANDVFRSIIGPLFCVLSMIVLLSIFPQASSSTIINYTSTFTFVIPGG